METNLFIFIGGSIIGIIIGYLIAKIYFLFNINSQRKDAINQSKSVILGQINEKIVPILPNFPYNFKDLVFIGKGIDYLVFDGLQNGKVENIIFMEVKSNKSTLNKNEKSIRDALENKKIKYEIWKV